MSDSHPPGADRHDTSAEETSTAATDSSPPYDPLPDAGCLPTPLDEQITAAVDDVDGRFEPLRFAPENYTREECIVEGNVDIDGTRERTVWEHPFYLKTIVESPKGDDFYYLSFADYKPVFRGSRFVTYCRAAAALVERAERKPVVPPMERRRLTRRLQDLCSHTAKRDQIRTVVERWAETTHEAAIRDALARALRRARCEYIDTDAILANIDHLRTWEDAVQSTSDA